MSILSSTAAGGSVGGWILVAAVLVPLIAGGIGYAVGRTNGRRLLGFVLGMFLGFIGWLITALLKPSKAELLRRDTNIASGTTFPFVVGAWGELHVAHRNRHRTGCDRLITPSETRQRDDGEAITCETCIEVLEASVARVRLHPSSPEVDAASHLRPCPSCAELIMRNAVICRFCGRSVELSSAER